MKATERYFLVVLFIVLYKVALTCGGGEGGGEAAGRERGRKGAEKCTGCGTERGCGKLNSHGSCN